jgi:hypothetical protein
MSVLACFAYCYIVFHLPPAGFEVYSIWMKQKQSFVLCPTWVECRIVSFIINALFVLNNNASSRQYRQAAVAQSVGIVRLRTEATEFSLVLVYYYSCFVIGLCAVKFARK